MPDTTVSRRARRDAEAAEKITGDTALSMLGSKGMKFARIGGQWFIRLQ